MSLDYKNAGVDVEAGYRSVELMKKHVKNTFRSEVLSDLGGFGGLFSISKAKEMDDPVLVSGTDGVGTKLKIAILLDRHETIGIDCVAMCVNDIICSGAEPLFFLDYIACGKNQPEKIAKIVGGVAEGCKLANVSLVGGETAEMPGIYRENEYDLAGFAVGILDNARAINPQKVRSGDVVIGISSSGLHSNGFSLVRKLLRPNENNVMEYIQSLSTTLGEELIKPTRIYVKPILELIKRIDIKGIANITGGGFIENIPRIMPKGLRPKIELGSWDIYPIFKLLKQVGELSDDSMFNVFNMGIGMVLVVDKNDADRAVQELAALEQKAHIIGEVTEGEGIEIC